MRSADRCKGIGYVQYHNEVYCNVLGSLVQCDRGETGSRVV